MIEIHLAVLAVAVLIGMAASYMAITERDLLKAVGYSAAQAVAYTIALYVLMAPDIVLAYVAIAVGVYSALLIFLISKTKRYEEGRVPDES